MFYNVLKLKKLAEPNGNPVVKEELMSNYESSLNIISIKKNEIIDTHTSTADAAVIVLDGEIELHFDAQKYKIEKGELLMFKKDEQHKVLALKDSKFILIRI